MRAVIDRKEHMTEAMAVQTRWAEIVMEDTSNGARIVLENATPPGTQDQGIALASHSQCEDVAGTLGEGGHNMQAISWLVLPYGPCVGRGAGDDINDIRLRQPLTSVITEHGTRWTVNHAIRIEAGTLGPMKGIVLWALAQAEIESRTAGKTLFLRPRSA